MTRGKVKFVGNFWEYFFISIVLFVLSLVTFGLMLPYTIYWHFKYFFTRLEIEFFDGSLSS